MNYIKQKPIVRFDRRIVLATTYGGHASCLASDLKGARTMEDVVRRARKWEINYILEEYRNLVERFVPEARFSNDCADSDKFHVRTDSEITNPYGFVEYTVTDTGNVLVNYPDMPDIFMDGIISLDFAIIAEQAVSWDQELVRQLEFNRKYRDIIEELKKTMPDGKEKRLLDEHKKCLDGCSGLATAVDAVNERMRAGKYCLTYDELNDPETMISLMEEAIGG